MTTSINSSQALAIAPKRTQVKSSEQIVRNTVIRVIYDSSNLDSCLAAIAVKALSGLIIPAIPGKSDVLHYNSIDAQHGQTNLKVFKEPDNSDILTFVLGVPLTAEELTTEAVRCKNRNRFTGGSNLIYVRYGNDHSIQNFEVSKQSYFSSKQKASKRLKDLSVVGATHEIHPSIYGHNVDDTMENSIYLMIVNYFDVQYKTLQRSLAPNQEIRRGVLEAAGISVSAGISADVIHSLINYQNFKTPTTTAEQEKQLRRVCGMRTAIQNLAAQDQKILPQSIFEAFGGLRFKTIRELCAGEEFIGLVKNIINRNMGFSFYKTTKGFFNLPTVCIPREFSHESIRRMRLSHKTAVTYEDCRYTRYYRIQSDDMAFAKLVAESLNPKEIWVENQVVCCCVDKSQQHLSKH